MDPSLVQMLQKIKFFQIFTKLVLDARINARKSVQTILQNKPQFGHTSLLHSKAVLFSIQILCKSIMSKLTYV